MKDKNSGTKFDFANIGVGAALSILILWFMEYDMSKTPMWAMIVWCLATITAGYVMGLIDKAFERHRTNYVKKHLGKVK